MHQATQRTVDGLHAVTSEGKVRYTEVLIGHAVYTIDLQSAGICVSLSDDQIVLVCEQMMERAEKVGNSHVFYAPRSTFRRALFSKTGTIRKKRNVLDAAQLVDILAPKPNPSDESEDLFYDDEDRRPLLNLYFRGAKACKRAQQFLDLMRNSDFAQRINVADEPRSAEDKTWLVIDRRGTRIDDLKDFSAVKATLFDDKGDAPGIRHKSLIVY